jgi:ATP-dependent DNA helicase RecQ
VEPAGGVQKDHVAAVVPGVADGVLGDLHRVPLALLEDREVQLPAHDLQLPPYVIFQDPSLEAMATTYPITLDEMQNVPGVGAGKAQRYGADFVRIIKQYVSENEIERPEDLRVRSVANKSKLKIQIIQAIDRKIDLSEIAVSNNLDFDQLLEEIEAIVNSGTKINISYFLDEYIDEEDQDEVFEYFRECDTDDLDEAYRQLCPDYKEEEVRLLRIKFLSEHGN